MNKGSYSHTFFLLIVFISTLFTGACSKEKANRKAEASAVTRMDEYTTSKKYPSNFADESIEEWKKQIPEIEDVKITSTMDGKIEPALFYASNSENKKPLLVVLHSWSSKYLQEVSMPYAIWAKRYDWAFIQPNYRGAFNNPEAMGSDVAIQDIIDAVNFAKGNTNIDPDRIYMVGSSGGAMTALVAASRRPDIWAGVAAWVPVFDLVDWFAFTTQYPERYYIENVMCACSGRPIPGTEAAEECKRRSPSTQLSNARGVPMFLAHALTDVLVPVDHSIRAFNILAQPADTISKTQIRHMLWKKELPLNMESEGNSPYFSKKDPKVLFTRNSGNVHFVIYDGVHDMAYNPSLLWLSEQKKNK
jgi:dipeptidyl aminopeptidase/acylaminoacyl peptidase